MPGPADSDGLTLLDAALSYAARGWPVFPCSPDPRKGRGKQPLVKSRRKGEGGLHLATTDEAQIRAWWERWPKALIGVPTGAPIGAFVVDCDLRDGETADQVLGRVAELAGYRLPDGPISRTQSGGLHLWFSYPENLREPLGNRAGVIPHVDVRGTGGYVIVPSSVMGDGKAYTWEVGLDQAEPPAPPERLLDAILRRGAFAKDAGAAGRETIAKDQATRVAEGVRRYALAALDDETQRVANCGSGQRNSTLNNAAFSLGQFVAAGALLESVVWAALETAASQCGLTKDDGIRSVRATIRSGLKAGLAEPRDLSEVEQSARQHGARRGANPAAPSAAGGNDPPDDDAETINSETIESCAEEPQNDTGNGRRLLAHFGDELMHVREWGWHYWAKTHWEREGGDEAATRLGQQTAERIQFELRLLGGYPNEKKAVEAADKISHVPVKDRTEAQKAIVAAGAEASTAIAKRLAARARFAVSSGNQSRITAMIAQALPHCTVPPDEMDADPLAFNCRNGTLRFVSEPDLECPDPDVTRLIWTVRLDEHDRADRIAKVAPVEFDPEARCPTWDAFLERFQPTEPVRIFLRDFHGYALTGLTGQSLIFNYGRGANGKSTFIEAICRLLGPYAATLNAESVTGQAQRRGDQATPDFARLPGARLVRVSELPRGEPLKESLVKALTGGEPITARHLNKGFFEFRPVFKPAMSGNDLPTIHGVDHGIWRRVRLVPWNVIMPEDDPERRDFEEVQRALERECSGILNWLIDGALAYLNAGRLAVPAEVQDATAEYRKDMDPVGRFLEACVKEYEGGKVPAREMYQAYAAWCQANSVKPFTETTFGKRLPAMGIKKTDGRIRHYVGVYLSDVPAADDGAADPRSPPDIGF